MRQTHADAVGLSWHEGMADDSCANAEFAVRSDIITQCGLQVEVGNACAPVEFASFELVVEVVAVIADDEGCIEEPSAAEVVRPAQRARGVAPSVVEPVGMVDAAHGLDDIVASIEREINAVVLPDFGVDFRVQVVESRHKRHIFVGANEKVDETPTR